MEDFRHINRELNMTVIVNIHHVELAMQYADRIIGIQAGEVVYDGPVHTVTEEILQLIYRGDVEEGSRILDAHEMATG
ncbi:phosphonate/organophosphate ester transporter subunit [compost metagenome]